MIEGRCISNVLARQPRPLPMVLHALGNAGCQLHALVRQYPSVSEPTAQATPRQPRPIDHPR